MQHIFLDYFILKKRIQQCKQMNRSVVNLLTRLMTRNRLPVQNGRQDASMSPQL